MARSLSLALVILPLFPACRQQGAKEPLSQPMGLAGTACIRAPQVKFAVPKPNAAAPRVAPVSAMPKSRMDLSITPNDLAQAQSLTCGKDGICEAVLNRPISIDEAVPVGLNTKVRLGYEQKPDKDGDICLRTVKVGGQFNAMPHCLGNIVYANIDVGVNVTQKVDKDTKDTELKAEPYCRANVGCSMPFLSFGVTADDKGITFNGTASSKDVTDNRVLRKVLPEKSATTKVVYKDLPEAIKQLKDTVAVVSDAVKNPDLTWDIIAESCDPSTP